MSLSRYFHVESSTQGQIDALIRYIETTLVDCRTSKGNLLKIAILEEMRSILSQKYVSVWDWLCFTSKDYFCTTPIDPRFYGSGLCLYKPQIDPKTLLQQRLGLALAQLTRYVQFVEEQNAICEINAGNGTVDRSLEIWDGSYFSESNRRIHRYEHYFFTLKFGTGFLFDVFRQTPGSIWTSTGIDELLYKHTDKEIETDLLHTYWDQLSVCSQGDSLYPFQPQRTDISLILNRINEQKLSFNRPTDTETQKTVLGWGMYKPCLQTPTKGLTYLDLESKEPELPFVQRAKVILTWLQLPEADIKMVQSKCNYVRSVQRAYADLNNLPIDTQDLYDEAVCYLNTHRTKQGLFNLLKPTNKHEWKIYSEFCFKAMEGSKRQNYGCIVDPIFRKSESR